MDEVLVALADAAATGRAGAALARHVRPGDAIALIGELGAGKTALVAGLVSAFGGGPATSPTFSLINEYRGYWPAGGDAVVWHVDLYRLERPSELVELGLDEVLGDRRGIVLIEWADRFDVMPVDHLRIELAHASPGRTVVARGTGGRGVALASAWTDDLLGSAR
ncbi:MAG: tRNA (adenosine(37)-N6)-threonylcarbamoyltransferase complex ATPase subunit type 1 TsaE [Kofleriaceae bacterium]